MFFFALHAAPREAQKFYGAGFPSFTDTFSEMCRA